MVLNSKHQYHGDSFSTSASLGAAFSPEVTVPEQLVELTTGVLRILHHYEGSTERFKKFMPVTVKQSDSLNSGSSSRSLFLVTEYFPQTLEQIMCDIKPSSKSYNGPLTTFISMVLYQLLSVLQLLQVKNVVHRNIGCDSIFIDNNLCPVLGGFRHAIALIGADNSPLLFRSKTDVNAGDDCAWAPELVHFCDKGPSPSHQVG